LLHIYRPSPTVRKGFLNDRGVDFRKGGNLADNLHDLMGVSDKRQVEMKGDALGIFLISGTLIVHVCRRLACRRA
jgi:hypothetical protein